MRAIPLDTVERVRQETLSALHHLRGTMQLTTGKIEQEVTKALRSSGVIEITAQMKAEVDELCRQQRQRHAEGEKVKTAAKRGLMQFLKNIGWVD